MEITGFEQSGISIPFRAIFPENHPKHPGNDDNQEESNSNILTVALVSSILFPRASEKLSDGGAYFLETVSWIHCSVCSRS
jgi:hypothetical protein